MYCSLNRWLVYLPAAFIEAKGLKGHASLPPAGLRLLHQPPGVSAASLRSYPSPGSRIISAKEKALPQVQIVALPCDIAFPSSCLVVGSRIPVLWTTFSLSQPHEYDPSNTSCVETIHYGVKNCCLFCLLIESEPELSLPFVRNPLPHRA